jgi:DNA/RNA-binding domain of Phe-tRNA-synthetase-like protein
MKITFSPIINEKLSTVRLGILRFKAKVEPSKADFWLEVDKQSFKIREGISSDKITTIPTIAYTRKAYKSCGKDPSRYRPSADSLIRRIVKGNDLYKVNNVVDVLNLISLQSGISIGGYDISKIVGNALLDIGTDKDEYYGIGRGLLNIKGLPVLRDEEGVFGSPTSDSERTMISEKATDIAFVYFDFGVSEVLEDTIISTTQLLKSYCNTSDFSSTAIEL